MEISPILADIIAVSVKLSCWNYFQSMMRAEAQLFEMEVTSSSEEKEKDKEEENLAKVASIAASRSMRNSQKNVDGNEKGKESKDGAEQDTRRMGLDMLDVNVLSQIMEFVDQFDLVNLAPTCSRVSVFARERLYKRVTVVLDAEFALSYKGDERRYISENGIKFMNSSIIFTLDRLLKFYNAVKDNKYLISQVKFFVFDKCFETGGDNIYSIQTELMDFFGEYSTDLSFLHITFVDLKHSITNLRKFLKNENVRNKVFKLFAKSFEDLASPMTPPCLTNLFLMLSESELMKIEDIDPEDYPFQLFNSLFTLTCSTDNSLGLELLKRLKLVNDTMKLKLKAFTLYHNHREDHQGELQDAGRLQTLDGLPFEIEIPRDTSIKLDRRLNFHILENKIDLNSLSYLSLRVDCDEHRENECKCFGNFFEDLTKFSKQNEGLPNLVSFELELFPNFEWFRPHQILERVLTPLGNFTMSLSNLSKLTIDFSTPGFKMFSNMSSTLLNKLNERLVEAFFLGFYPPQAKSSSNIRILQLPDFLTSFIYYRPQFYESILHTCKCWGCYLLLEKLRKEFLPIRDREFSDNEEGMDDESSYFVLMGYLLGKLQTDREVCTPISEKAFNYKNYPLCKGEPHTLHKNFHNHRRSCNCDIAGDPHGQSDMNIDNLVTTYIVHQLSPFVLFLSTVFVNLEYLVIHGITYELDKASGNLVPVYDAHDYPPALLATKSDDIKKNDTPPMAYGIFKNPY